MRHRLKALLLTFAALVTLSSCSPAKNITASEIPSTSETSAAYESGNLSVTYLDVGQADCTLLQCDGEAMLIDGGDENSGTRIQKVLTDEGIDSLKYVVGTHPHSDHIGGLDVIITKFDVENVFLPDIEGDTSTYEELLDAMDYKAITPIHPDIGDCYMLGSAYFTFLSDGSGYEDDINNSSLVLKVINGENEFLFTGDAEEPVETALVNSGADISADVLKIGHHGSSTSTCEEFLNKVDPTAVVISCGKDNDYGHPHDEVMERLTARDIDIYRTDESGTVTAISDGTDISFNSEPSDSYRPPEAEEYYVLNTNSMKIHRPDCDSVSDMSEKNKEITKKTRDELISEGYSPCGSCKP